MMKIPFFIAIMLITNFAAAEIPKKLVIEGGQSVALTLTTNKASDSRYSPTFIIGAESAPVLDVHPSMAADDALRTILAELPSQVSENTILDLNDYGNFVNKMVDEQFYSDPRSWDPDRSHADQPQIRKAWRTYFDNRDKDIQFTFKLQVIYKLANAIVQGFKDENGSPGVSCSSTVIAEPHLEITAVSTKSPSLSKSLKAVVGTTFTKDKRTRRLLFGTNHLPLTVFNLKDPNGRRLHDQFVEDCNQLRLQGN